PPRNGADVFAVRLRQMALDLGRSRGDQIVFGQCRCAKRGRPDRFWKHHPFIFGVRSGVFEKNGKIYSLDNRRLYVFQQAGVKIRWVKADPKTVKREVIDGDKWSTKNDGKSIRVRKGKSRK